MMTAAQRAPIRRWFYAAYFAMSSAERGVHHAALRYALETGRFVRARIRVRSTRLAPWRAPVAPVLDNQRRPDAMGRFEKSHDTDGFRWLGPQQGDVRRPQSMGAAAVLPPTTWPGEQAPPTTDARTASLRLDLTVAMRVGIRAVYVTVEALTRSASRQHGPRMRGISEATVLRRWYRRWLAPDGL